jgi:hypothetical protein
VREFIPAFDGEIYFAASAAAGGAGRANKLARQKRR